MKLNSVNFYSITTIAKKPNLFELFLLNLTNKNNQLTPRPSTDLL